MVALEYGSCHRSPFYSNRNQPRTSFVISVRMSVLQFPVKRPATIPVSIRAQSSPISAQQLRLRVAPSQRHVVADRVGVIKLLRQPQSEELGCRSGAECIAGRNEPIE